MNTRQLLPVVAAVAVLGLLAGIWALTPASEDRQVGTGPPPGAPPSSAPSAVPSAPRPSTEPGHRKDGPRDLLRGARGERLVGVDGYLEDATGALRVTFTHGAPACHGEVGEPAVDESADRVVVTLTAAPPSGPPGQVCDMMLREGVASAQLASPLAGRTVVDGSTGRPVAASSH